MPNVADKFDKPRALISAASVGTHHSTELQALLAKTSTSFLQPVSFFVSWQGVLTLAYRYGRLCLHHPRVANILIVRACPIARHASILCIAEAVQMLVVHQPVGVAPTADTLTTQIF